ncbi:MAG: sulfatase-like hydrolase/transferase [Bacteroidota bacterium]
MQRLFLCLYVCLGLLTACQKPSSELPPPNIIWIIAEDISPALGAYGHATAHTPNLDRLAAGGIRYHRAYATAPICAPARSCLATGMFATSLGTHHLRSEIPFPDSLKALPDLMQEAGYFTTIRGKTDFNFDPEGLWDHWSNSYAPWRNRQKDQPFFSYINVGPTHEGAVNKKKRYEALMQDLPDSLRADTAMVQVPPYFPQTARMKEIMARYDNVITLMDRNVGMILDSLEADGLLDQSIIFFLSDHGFGLPRYKRWLYHSGLNVPLLVRIPPAYRHLNPYGPGAATDQLISFVDMAPTALHLTGQPIPENMQGQPFLGEKLPKPREKVFAARDRADDMFEMSRAVITDRYIYIRHFMPHLEPMQSGFIFSDVKDAFRELTAAREAGLPFSEREKFWDEKPLEELYDLKEDPHELHNLLQKPSFKAEAVCRKMGIALWNWMEHSRDLGLLPEAEYIRLSEDESPWQAMQSEDNFPIHDLGYQAYAVGSADFMNLRRALKHAHPGVRYWGIMGVRNHAERDTVLLNLVQKLLQDESPSVSILAAETLCHFGQNDAAVLQLGDWVGSEMPRVALEAARSIQMIGAAARPLIPVMYGVLEKNLGEPGGKRKYKDFTYAAFTSWALEWALQELGEKIKVNE